MFAGQLNECIEIYDFVTTKSKTGVVTETMTLSYQTRAKVGHISGSRQVINNEIVTPYVKNFVIRFYVPVNDTSWIKYNGKYYRVTSIDANKELQQKIVIGELVQE